MSRRGVFSYLLQFAFSLLMIFLGWGLDDLRGFFAEPARAGFIALMLIGAAVVLGSRLDVEPFRKGQQPKARWLLIVWIAVGIFLAWFLPHADRRGWLVFAHADALRYAGLGLTIAGSVIRIVAVRVLGRQFSAHVTLQTNHRLVQAGIYRLIRHPMYLGGLLMMPGLALVFRSWLVIFVFAATTAFVLARIRAEEKLLAEHFGAEFEAYRRRTWRLLPYLY